MSPSPSLQTRNRRLAWVAVATAVAMVGASYAAVPLYATFSAQGVAAAADWGARVARRFGSHEAARARFGRGLGAIVAVVLLGALTLETRVWMGFWRDSIARGWPQRSPSSTTVMSSARASS